jgi:flagellar basal body-associated protein FliL
VSFSAITLCVASQRVFIIIIIIIIIVVVVVVVVVVYFVIDSVRKLLDTPSYLLTPLCRIFFEKQQQPASFMEPEDSLTCSQKPATGLYPDLKLYYT